MEEKKPSTADILAKIRAQKAAAASPAESPVAPAADSATPVPPVETPAAAAPEPAVPAAPATPPKPAAPTAKPGSTKDILAAIRAGGAKPAAPAAAPTPAAPVATPVAKAPAAAGTAPAAAAGPRPSVQEMLKAVREGKVSAPTATAAAAAAKPASPVAALPMPAKPVPIAAKAKPDAVRRGLAGLTTVATLSGLLLLAGALMKSSLLVFLGVIAWSLLMSPFAAAWAAVAGITGVWTLGVARFMFPNVLVEPPSKFKIGPLSDYPINTVSNKWKDQFGIWIVHTDQYEGRNLIFALTSVCTHLGCTPNWLDGEQKFKCPCHGSGFYITGINFEGPAPRPLERAGLRIAEDGMLEVNKSVKFQEEMGQWADPTSFVNVV